MASRCGATLASRMISSLVPVAAAQGNGSIAITLPMQCKASELDLLACASWAHASCTAQHASVMPRWPHAPADLLACCRFRDVAMHCTALVWAGPEKGDDVYERFRGCRRPGTNRLIGGGWPLQVQNLYCAVCVHVLSRCHACKESWRPQGTSSWCLQLLLVPCICLQAADLALAHTQGAPLQAHWQSGTAVLCRPSPLGATQ